ncbi:hypothetical protein ACOSQ2_022860 [Xanthoceras sorbifolium]
MYYESHLGLPCIFFNPAITNMYTQTKTNTHNLLSISIHNVLSFCFYFVDVTKMANPGDDNSEKPKSKEHVENVETTPPMSSPTSAPAPTVEGGILGSLRADRGSAAGDGDAVEVDTGYGEATPPGGDQDSGFENQLAREENGVGPSS